MKHDIAQRVMDMALKYGAPEVRVMLFENEDNTIAVRNGELDTIEHSMSLSVAVNLFIDGRDGFFYTSDMDEASLEAFVANGVQSTRLLAADPAQRLPDSSLYYKGGGEDLKTFDSELQDVSPEAKVSMAIEANKMLQDNRIISAETRYSDRIHRGLLLASNGLDVEDSCTRVSLTDIVTIDDPNGRHPIDGWGNSRICWHDFPWQDIAGEALRRTVAKVGQRPAATGRYTMIVESPVASDLLRPMLRAMSGWALWQKTSFLANSMNAQVGSSLLNIVDDPLVPGTRGATYFDNDGVATQRRILFEDGILRTFFIDTTNSIRLGMPVTTGGTHRLLFAPGKKTLAEMVASVDNGILVTDFNGGNTDPSTGNFSYGIEGILIRNGQIEHPVCGMNITGSMLQLWKQLIDVANDADPWETEVVPSLCFTDVAFSGQ